MTFSFTNFHTHYKFKAAALLKNKEWAAEKLTLFVVKHELNL